MTPVELKAWLKDQKSLGSQLAAVYIQELEKSLEHMVTNIGQSQTEENQGGFFRARELVQVSKFVQGSPRRMGKTEMARCMREIVERTAYNVHTHQELQNGE